MQEFNSIQFNALIWNGALCVFLFSRVEVYDYLNVTKTQFSKWLHSFKALVTHYGNTDCRVFKRGVQNQIFFLPMNQHTQRKLLNFKNWVSGDVSKSAKSPNLLTFKVNFLYQKLSESFSIFFSLKNINLGAHFLLLTFFDNINF